MRQSLSMGTTLLQATEVFPGYPCPVLIDQAGQMYVLFFILTFCGIRVQEGSLGTPIERAIM